MNRRDFLRDVAGATAGVVCAASRLGHAAGVEMQTGVPRRRDVVIGGRRVKTIDVHAHVSIPEAAALSGRGGGTGRSGGGGGAAAPGGRGGGAGTGVNLVMDAERLRAMDAQGIDVQVLSINPTWYGLDRDVSSRLIDLQNEKLAELVEAQPDRFVALATVALQHPDMAADQLDVAVKKWKMRGAAIGGSINGEELSSAKFDPFWAKAEALGALIFIHPQNAPAGANPRLQGNGVLSNVIGNPLETTIALSHLIFEGTLDRFPGLKLFAAHAGGYLPSYSARMDHGCLVFPEQCKDKSLQRHPSEYLKQMYFDSMVFTSEGLRHLVAEVGVGHIMIGTDYPYPWTSTAVDHVLGTPGLSDADRIAILGGTAAKLFGIPT